MNPNSTPNLTPDPIQNPSPMAVPTGALPTEGRKHVALTIVLVVLILAAFGFLGWKWFVGQQETIRLEAQNAAMQSNFSTTEVPDAVTTGDASSASSSDGSDANQASVSRGIQSSDTLDADMSIILNSSSEEDLKSIDREF